MIMTLAWLPAAPLVSTSAGFAGAATLQICSECCRRLLRCRAAEDCSWPAWQASRKHTGQLPAHQLQSSQYGQPHV